MSRRAVPFVLLSLLLCGSLSATTRTWTGANSALWSDSGNWSPAGAPVSGDSLTFNTASPVTLTNDIAGLSLAGITVSHPFTLDGDALTLTGDVTTGPWTCDVDLTIGAPLTLAFGTYKGAIDVNGQTLTLGTVTIQGALNGTGSITTFNTEVTVSHDGNFNGTMTAELVLEGASLPDMAITGPSAVLGNGTLGDVTMSPQPPFPGGHPAWYPTVIAPGSGTNDANDHTAGLLTMKSLRLSGAYLCDLYPGAPSDQLKVTGSLEIYGSLQVTLPAGAAVAGQTFKIIDNLGNGPVTGTFGDLPEGAIFNIGTSYFRITYQGGDGNDVVIEATEPEGLTSTSLSLSSPQNVFGHTMTMTATVAFLSPGTGTPEGTVCFFSDGVAIGTAGMVNGTAVFPTPFVVPGMHAITAFYMGAPFALTSTSSPLTLTVSKSPAALSASADPNPSPMGTDVHLQIVLTDTGNTSFPVVGTLTVTLPAGPQGPAETVGTVTGVFTTAPTTMTVSGLPSGDYQFDISFDGDPNYESSHVVLSHTVASVFPPTFQAAKYAFGSAGGTPLMLEVDTPATGQGPFPAIIWVSGAASYAPGPGGSSPALRETTRGYIVVTPFYRAAGTAVFPAQLDDLQAAVRWIRANAASLDIDPHHIGIWGSGAGAHLAALVGTTADYLSADGLKEGNPAVSQRVQAVVDWAGPADLLQLQGDTVNACVASHDGAGSPESLLIGCALQTCPSAAEAASPQTFAGPAAAPILLMHGANDCVVGPEQSRRFYGALKAAGVDATLHVIDGVGTLSDAWWSSQDVFNEVDAFLDAHLKAPPRRRSAAH